MSELELRLPVLKQPGVRHNATFLGWAFLLKVSFDSVANFEFLIITSVVNRTAITNSNPTAVMSKIKVILRLFRGTSIFADCSGIGSGNELILVQGWILGWIIALETGLEWFGTVLWNVNIINSVLFQNICGECDVFCSKTRR